MCKRTHSALYCGAFSRWWKWWGTAKPTEDRLIPWQTFAASFHDIHELTNTCRLEILNYLVNWCGLHLVDFFRDYAQEPDKQKVWQERDEWLRTTYEKIAQGNDEKRHVLAHAPYQHLRVAQTLPVRVFFRARDSMLAHQATYTLNICSILLDEFSVVLPNRIIQGQIDNIMQWCETAFCVVTPEQLQPVHSHHRPRWTRALRKMNRIIADRRQRAANMLAMFINSLDVIRFVILPFIGV